MAKGVRAGSNPALSTILGNNMTRINCIDPKYLSDYHLRAEYKELPRIFNLARHTDIPDSYRLGKGHVLFFYDKLGYLVKRQHRLIEEMLQRGMRPKYLKPWELIFDKDIELCNDWNPRTEDKQLNISRINERGGLR